MSRLHTHSEFHLVSRIGWLRAAVQGANDGIVPTSSLIVGVAAASAATSEVLVAGVARLIAGAMSMAAGEYVSVSSQSDTEHADLACERAELATQPEFEREELAKIYIDHGGGRGDPGFSTSFRGRLTVAKSSKQPFSAWRAIWRVPI